METRLRQRALELAARAVERRFNDDLSDHLGPTQPWPRYAGRRDKTFEMKWLLVCGEIEVR